MQLVQAAQKNEKKKNLLIDYQIIFASFKKTVPQIRINSTDSSYFNQQIPITGLLISSHSISE